MPADDEREALQPSPSTRATIARIADTLGCSVDDLIDGARDPIATKGLSELTTIWVEMDDDRDRQRLLEFARQIAASR